MFHHLYIGSRTKTVHFELLCNLKAFETNFSRTRILRELTVKGIKITEAFLHSAYWL